MDYRKRHYVTKLEPTKVGPTRDRVAVSFRLSHYRALFGEDKRPRQPSGAAGRFKEDDECMRRDIND